MNLDGTRTGLLIATGPGAATQLKAQFLPSINEQILDRQSACLLSAVATAAPDRASYRTRATISEPPADLLYPRAISARQRPPNFGAGA